LKVNRGFFIQVFGALVAIAVLAAFPLVRYGSDEILAAVITGALLATVNGIAGYLAIEYSIGKSHSTFLKAVLGGMAVRLGTMLALLLVLIEIFHVHAVALSLSLLSCYTVFLVLEVIFVQKKIIIKNQS